MAHILLLCCLLADARKKVTQPLMDDLMPKGIALSDYQSDDISFKVSTAPVLKWTVLQHFNDK